MERSIVFLLGSARSGSSALERYLSRKYNGTALGEVRWAFERGARDNDKCGCGKRNRSCSFWSQFDYSDYEIRTLACVRRYLDLPFVLRIFAKSPGNKKIIY